VGAGSADYADNITTLVWVEAPRELRLERAIARDLELHDPPGGREALRDQLERWMAHEDTLHARHRTRERADVVVPGVE
jgi:hypothetical protein